jgi:3-oxo-5-alpha-steroid 4-dehydrogenase 1
MRGGKPMPVGVTLLAFLWCVCNGFLQGASLCVLHRYDAAWLRTPNFVVGASLFAYGFLANLRADAILRSLRRPGETGYRIPRGGLFEYVSSANYLAEIIEWLGFALATSNAAGWAFFVFTLANLVPRALAHHRWYQAKFKDEYPRFRRAIVPFVL